MAEYEIEGTTYTANVVGLFVVENASSLDCYFLKPMRGFDFDGLFRDDPNWNDTFNRDVILYPNVMYSENQDTPKVEKLAYLVWNEDMSFHYEREVLLNIEEKLVFNILLAQCFEQ